MRSGRRRREAEQQHGGRNSLGAGEADPDAARPPQWFDARGRVPLPEAATEGRTNLAGQVRGGGEDLPLLLHGARAFVVSPSGVQVVDLADGRTVGEEAARGEVLRQDTDGFILPPVLAGSEVLVPFLLTMPASGTHTAGAMVEVVAVSTAPPYKAAWRTTVKLPEWALQTSAKVQVAAVGAENGTAVVTVKAGDDAVSYGIDAASHALRWTQPGLEAVQVATGMAVGLLHVEPLTSVPLGVDLATGTEKWRGEKTYNPIMNGAGPGTVRLAGTQTGGKGDQLLDVSSGKARAAMPPGMSAMSCTYDRSQTLVCTHGFAVVAIDTATGALLWALKDGDQGRTPRPSLRCGTDGSTAAVWAALSSWTRGPAPTCPPSRRPHRSSSTNMPGWCSTTTACSAIRPAAERSLSAVSWARLSRASAKPANPPFLVRSARSASSTGGARSPGRSPGSAPGSLG